MTPFPVHTGSTPPLSMRTHYWHQKIRTSASEEPLGPQNVRTGQTPYTLVGWLVHSTLISILIKFYLYFKAISFKKIMNCLGI